MVLLAAQAGEVHDFTCGQTAEWRTAAPPAGQTACWRRRGAAATPATTRPPWWVPGQPGLRLCRGDVFGVHVCWSGSTAASCPAAGRRASTRSWGRPAPAPGSPRSAGARSPLPGETVLAQRESYATPWGCTWPPAGPVSTAWRRSSTVPAVAAADPRTPRPGNLNVWEAVYPARLPALGELADLGAGIGVERYVLDDGGLRPPQRPRGPGDWQVDEAVGPAGCTGSRIMSGPGHGVRSVVRARDGEPRLRAVPGPPGLDPVRRRAGAAAAA